MSEEQQLLASLEYPQEKAEQIRQLVHLLYRAYKQNLPNVGLILINILKKKGVRLTENFEAPLDAGLPV